VGGFHGDLCEAVGLELEPTETGQLSAVRRRRDPRMLERVLTAYEYRCAFCGYDGRVGAVPVGVEAAHVRWWAFDGPADVDNGLCSNCWAPPAGWEIVSPFTYG
jgi:putative restriction endonuclease